MLLFAAPPKFGPVIVDNRSVDAGERLLLRRNFLPSSEVIKPPTEFREFARIAWADLLFVGRGGAQPSRAPPVNSVTSLLIRTSGSPNSSLGRSSTPMTQQSSPPNEGSSGSTPPQCVPFAPNFCARCLTREWPIWGEAKDARMGHRIVQDERSRVCWMSPIWVLGDRAL